RAPSQGRPDARKWKVGARGAPFVFFDESVFGSRTGWARTEGRTDTPKFALTCTFVDGRGAKRRLSAVSRHHSYRAAGQRGGKFGFGEVHAGRCAGRPARR